MRLRAEVDDVGAEAGHAALAERRAVRLLGLRVHLVHHVNREEELLLRNAALQFGGKSRLQDFRRQLTILPLGNLICITNAHFFDILEQQRHSYLEPDAGALGVVALDEDLLAVVEVVHLRLIPGRRGRLRGYGRHGGMKIRYSLFTQNSRWYEENAYLSAMSCGVRLVR